ncbi:MAG: hypothetical protein V7744_03670 [Pseudomonadales bacterium]
MKKIVVLGGGLHCLYCINILETMGSHDIVGLVDSALEIGSQQHGYRVIGRQEKLAELVTEFDITGCVIALGDNCERWEAYKQIKQLTPEIDLINVIHPTAILCKEVILGEGIILGPGVIISPGCSLGHVVNIANGVSLGTQNQLEDCVSISVGSRTGGRVHIGALSAITMGVTIVDRLSIGANTVVGAGSLVLSNLGDDLLAYGNPARAIRRRKKGERFLN